MTHDENKTPAWLEAFGDQLEAASRASNGKRRRRSNVKAMGVAVGVLLALPGFAFAVSAWNNNPPEPAPSAGIIAEPGEALTGGAGRSIDPNPAVNGGPVCEVARARRQLKRADSSTAVEAMASSISALDGGSDKLVSYGEFRLLLSVRAPEDFSDLPRTPECERFRKMPTLPAQLCISEASDPNGGEGCNTPAAVEAGRAFFVEDRIPGARAGTARIFGMVSDNVSAVRLTFRGRPAGEPSSEVVPVRNNVYALEYNGSAAVPPAVSIVKSGG